MTPTPDNPSAAARRSWPPPPQASGPVPSYDRERVVERATGQRRLLGRETSITSCSQGLGWSGFTLERHSPHQVHEGEVVFVRTLLLLHLGCPVSLQFNSGGSLNCYRIQPGHISLIPAGTTAAIKTDDVMEFVIIGVDSSLITLAGCSIGEPALRPLRLELGIDDPFLSGVCHALLNEAEERGRHGARYSESLATSMALHLIMNYPVTAQPPPPHPAPPTADPLHPGIRRAIERILSQLDRDLPLRELAAAAELSPFHFTRLFRKSVGLPPHQFLILKRIERARQLMMGGNLGLAEIALQSGFFDQSHLALHFKRACGMTPRQFINRITQPNASDDSSPDPGSPRGNASPAPRK